MAADQLCGKIADSDPPQWLKKEVCNYTCKGYFTPPNGPPKNFWEKCRLAGYNACMAGCTNATPLQVLNACFNVVDKVLKTCLAAACNHKPAQACNPAAVAQ
jgi:hypothetical protein